MRENLEITKILFLYRFSREQLSFTTPQTFQGAASSVLTGFSPHFLHMESIFTIFAEKFLFIT